MSLNKLEDNLNFLVNGRRPPFLVNERRPQYFNTGNTKPKPISTSGKTVLASPSLN